MPNADTYRRYADDLDAAAIEIAQTARGVTQANRSGFAEGGRVSAVIDTAIDATHANVSATVAALDILAGECRQRAAVCDQHRTDMLRYNRLKRAYLDTPIDERGTMVWPTKPHAPDWADWY